MKAFLWSVCIGLGLSAIVYAQSQRTVTFDASQTQWTEYSVYGLSDGGFALRACGRNQGEVACGFSEVRAPALRTHLRNDSDLTLPIINKAFRIGDGGTP